MEFKNYYFESLTRKIKSEVTKEENKIFVLLGQTDLIEDMFLFNSITNKETFNLNGGDDVFDLPWASNVFAKLQTKKDFHILSYPQYTYLLKYFSAAIPEDRFVIIKDNLRQLFPISKEDYIQVADKDQSIELRPDNLPIYQAEQIVINGEYYFSPKMPDERFKTINLFDETKPLRKSQNEGLDVVDITFDDYALDIFINNCILNNNFTKKIQVKKFNKQVLPGSLIEIMPIVNHLLSLFGGELFELNESDINDSYVVRDQTNRLLKTYWGDNAEFRNFKVYKNPDRNNEIIEISQGQIVETIIDEYHKTQQGEVARDLFLTAPTGSGKSLLFQLPSFHISNQGDVTIVVSPLIALMQDQVDSIIKERNFKKVAFLNSSLSIIDRERIVEDCKNGNIDILYMSPELLLSYQINHFIGERKLGLLVIDEAHLITTWGRDFRVDYWFLGNHIRKMRKYNKMNFPMVAVTATAIYGGDTNDMVLDSISSLVMHNPRIFVGQVKREDIKFLVNNYTQFNTNYEKNKIKQTVEFIKEIDKQGFKTLVYVPYVNHINKILEALSSEKLDIAVGYYGEMDADLKEMSFRQFKLGEKKIMVSTKAFGMGIDISDIEIVYHHAPSGLLPDYVQEIGRTARKENIKGFAAINYVAQDQYYSKALHGMSAIYQWQLREVLKKVHNTYTANKERRNMLLSVEDFGYIFKNEGTLDQMVLSSLMMIEKDYLFKNRFNVLIARPKKLFVKVYSRIKENQYKDFKNRYGYAFKKVRTLDNGFHIIKIDLDTLWQKDFEHISFPKLKHLYFSNKLFDNYEVIPQLEVSFTRSLEFEKAYGVLDNLLLTLEQVLSNKRNKFFTESEFKDEINKSINDINKSAKIAQFVLSSYTNRVSGQDAQPNNVFLQRRRNNAGEFNYRVFDSTFMNEFSSLRRTFINTFEHKSESVSKYVTNRSTNTEKYVRLGYFMDLLNLGTFEIKGGEKPMVFVRLNDPERVKRDANNEYYRNTLLERTLQKHKTSVEIFDHFFLRSFSNDERWNFIEDYFLGADIDHLINNYMGEEGGNNLDIIKYLKENEKTSTSKGSGGSSSGGLSINIFHPNREQYYKLNNLLTLNIEGEEKTMKVSKWLRTDPVSFDKVRKELNLKVEKEVFEILISKLRANHFEYFKSALGLRMLINYKPGELPIRAEVPYKNEPVEFYKWWLQNKKEINMSFAEKISLFDKVNFYDPAILKATHMRRLENK